MGTIILIITFVIEAAFAGYCLVTKSHQEKARSFLRSGAFAAFILFTLAAVIQWSLRWYGLAALLAIWAVFAALALVRKQEKKKDYKAGGVVFNAFAALLSVFIAVTPALIFPQYKMPETTGKYKVSTVQYTYSDESRTEEYTQTGEPRKVNVQFWYPENAEAVYPLVIFSHGGLGIKSSNVSLYTELASHGYVVSSIDHTYQAFWTKDEDGQVTFLSMDYFRDIQNEDAKTNKQQSFEYYQKWMSIRMGDINFVLDTILDNRSDGIPGVYSLVELEKIGVMGHSLGGSAALGIGRQRSEVKAVIALESPYMYDIEGVVNGEFVFNNEVYPVPVLNIYSDSSWSHLSEWAQYGKNYALLSEPGTKSFNAYISGVGHLALTDLSLTSPLLVRILDGKKPVKDSHEGLEIINQMSLNFFDCYLKNQGEFTEYGTY